MSQAYGARFLPCPRFESSNFLFLAWRWLFPFFFAVFVIVGSLLRIWLLSFPCLVTLDYLSWLKIWDEQFSSFVGCTSISSIFSLSWALGVHSSLWYVFDFPGCVSITCETWRDLQSDLIFFWMLEVQWDAERTFSETGGDKKRISRLFLQIF